VIGHFAQLTPTWRGCPAPFAGRYHRAVSAPTTSPSGGTNGSLLFPIGHYVGVHYRVNDTSPPRQVRRGGTIHELSEDQFAVWSAAHGLPDAIENGVAWQRHSVEEHPRVAGRTGTPEIIDQLLGTGLLAEAGAAADALDFARSHRVMPLMLGLGNRPDQVDMCGIGFLNLPAIDVSFAIYDLWQWSAMDDSLWATCVNAADVARRAGLTDPQSIEPTQLLSAFLGSLHALLLANAACLDIDFRLDWPRLAAVGRASAVGVGDDE
jgi:hypothetical protein